MNFKNIEELLDYTKNIKGKTFKDFDINKVLGNGGKDKGILGKIIETGFYKYPNNNKAEADFADLGVELKVIKFIVEKLDIIISLTSSSKYFFGFLINKDIKRAINANINIRIRKNIIKPLIFLDIF